MGKGHERRVDDTARMLNPSPLPDRVPLPDAPANTEPGGLFPAGTAVKHPERGMGFVVEVVRQGEQRPWRVLYGSGKVSRYALAAMHTLTQAFFDGLLSDALMDARIENDWTHCHRLQ